MLMHHEKIYLVFWARFVRTFVVPAAVNDGIRYDTTLDERIERNQTQEVEEEAHGRSSPPPLEAWKSRSMRSRSMRNENHPFVNHPTAERPFCLEEWMNNNHRSSTTRATDESINQYYHSMTFSSSMRNPWKDSIR